MMKLALCILWAVLAGACAKPTQPSPWEKLGLRVVDGQPQLGEVEIELTRTTCFGTCPAYTVQVSGSGVLTYTGEAFVKTKGTHTAVIDPQRLPPLLERFAQLDFLGHVHDCEHRVIDNSHASLMLRVGSRSRTAYDEICSGDADGMLGTHARAGEVEWHRKAFELEQAIDTLANIETWIGTEAERQAHGADWR